MGKSSSSSFIGNLRQTNALLELFLFSVSTVFERYISIRACGPGPLIASETPLTRKGRQRHQHLFNPYLKEKIIPIAGNTSICKQQIKEADVAYKRLTTTMPHRRYNGTARPLETDKLNKHECANGFLPHHRRCDILPPTLKRQHAVIIFSLLRLLLT